MKTNILIIILCLACIAAGCTNKDYIEIHSDPKFDYSKLRTFSEMKLGSESQDELSLLPVVRKVLEKKGFRGSGEPDFMYSVNITGFKNEYGLAINLFQLSGNGSARTIWSGVGMVPRNRGRISETAPEMAEKILANFY